MPKQQRARAKEQAANMIAERMPLFNGRLKSDVDNSSSEPSTVTATDLFLAGAVLDERCY